MSKLQDIFKRNGYPEGIFDKVLGKFLDKKFKSEKKRTGEDEEKYVILIVPYLGYVSDNFKKRVCSFGKKLGVNTRIVYKSFKISQYFSLKDVTPKGLKANVIYSFHCSCDKNISYIGKTIRHLAVRSKEHLKGNSAIYEHASNCQLGHNSNLDNFKILGSGSSDTEIRIKEALYIKKHRPKLNNQLSHNGMSYSVF